MPLPNGSKVGSFEIVAPLGAGGMGEVYRARDSKLKREVAIKVLPADVASDRERLARFQREAEVLASLNHPHIAHVYGIEDSALVMELVEGEDLSQRISRGAIPIDEALPIAKQIAEALEAAHDAGIIHRDLKPANIKVRDDGTVKVLDFGLAKAGGAGQAGEAGGELANSPTITSPAMTMRGVILGTAAYMAPEQAKGKPVDKRADIWAFGCVLYEMLTGKRAFKGDDVTDIITSVMRDTPDWSALPATTPLAIRTLLRRCLEKDARKRAPHMAIPRLAMDDAATNTAEPGAPIARSRSRLALWAIASVALAAVTGTISYQTARRTAVVDQTPATRSSLILPHNLFPRSPSQRYALAPDGRRLAYVAIDPGNGRLQLFVRPLDGSEAQPLAGTEDAISPFWSPDSRSIGFFAGGDLKRIDAGGGPVTTITRDVGIGPMPGTWNRDDVILFSRKEVIVRVAARGGDPVAVTATDSQQDIGHDLPSFLPDGQHFLYVAYRGLTPVGTYVTALAGGASTKLLADASNAVFASGFLLFVRDDALLAQPFNPERRELSGEAVTVAEGVLSNITTRVAASFSVSQEGAMVYQTTRSSWSPDRLVWATRDGTQTIIVDKPSLYRHLALSPDGTRVATTVIDDDGKSDVWLLEIASGQRMRLTFDGRATGAVWSREGRTLIVAAGGGDFLLKNADGSRNDGRIAIPTGSQVPLGASPDGRFVLFEYFGGSIFNADVWSAALDGSRQPQPVLGTNASERWAALSPDGKLIAYTSDMSGPRDVYVTDVADSGRWQVSANGGSYPRWSHDGHELYFFQPGTSKLVAATVHVRGNNVTFGPITPLFNARTPPGFGRYFYDVAPDGRFLMSVPTASESGTEITLLTNWTSLLKGSK